jgi:uncharacterized membrane protein YeaQ/YmgE (transglycosylase-associated protein family)
MIMSVVAACVTGVLVGVSSDELLRGRDPRSRRVMVAGIVGALVALAIRRSMGGDSWLLEVLTVLFGALVVAFATRVRISSTLARGPSV